MKRTKLTILIVIVLLIVLLPTVYVVMRTPGSTMVSTTATTSRTATSTGAPTYLSNQNNITVRITDSMALPNVGVRFDHMSIDIPAQSVFIAARGNNSVYVADLVTEGISHIITGLNEPQGVCYDQKNNQLYVSNGGDGTVDVFNVSNYHLVKVLNFSTDADNLRYDPSTSLLYVGYGEENQSGLGIINTTTDTIVGSIPLNGHPEAFAISQNGTDIFVNVPTANAIEVANKTSRTVIASWPLTNATENFPMALDEQNNRLFVGFGLPPGVNVYDTNTGQVVAHFGISSDSDDMYYDASSNLIFVSCSSGYLDVIKQINADSYESLVNLTTGPLGRTSLFYPQQNELFVAVPQHDRFAAQLLTFSVAQSNV